jgi:hypothetical protein
MLEKLGDDPKSQLYASNGGRRLGLYAKHRLLDKKSCTQRHSLTLSRLAYKVLCRINATDIIGGNPIRRGDRLGMMHASPLWIAGAPEGSLRSSSVPRLRSGSSQVSRTPEVVIAT